MRLSLTVDDRTVPLRSLVFPGGEVQVRIEAPAFAAAAVTIRADIVDSATLMALLVLTDAVRRHYADPAIDLVCPYLPYARQDRVAFPGEALSAAVACRLLNAQNYRSVEVWDVHSDVSLALLDRVRHRPASDFAAPIVTPRDVVVAPDLGAAKRAGDCARLAGATLVRAEKTRSTDTGAITGTVVHTGPIGGRDFLIVDDICDGGRTFVELARVLRPLTTGRVRLYVTHGIFSAGFDALAAHIDRIHVANPFPADLPPFVQRTGA
ncbi:MAG: ribose-phosphate diphosphokinase [Janthinobacterium lividum]